MNPRRLFIVAITLSSAALGAGIALTGSFRPAAVPLQAIEKSLPLAASPAQPESTAASPFSPPEAPVPIAAETPNELHQIRIQLQRAIHDRNPVLLRSLLQASSLREALSGVATAEQINFNNLDASSWRILEQAINYRCQQNDSAATVCFNHPVQQPMPIQ